MEIRPLTGGLGAEIVGIDIRRDEAFPVIEKAFSDYSVITLRGQTITPDEQLAFGRRFGSIDVNRFFTALEGHPEIVKIVKEPGDNVAIGESWHTDHSYDAAPAMGSILHAVETPPYGGDTLFVSMALAFDALSPVMRGFLEGLSAWHSSRHAFGAATQDSELAKSGRAGNPEAATHDTLHPVAIRHPLSGRKCLYVNPAYTTRIEGLAEAESDAVLRFLFDHCRQPEFQCRVRWQPGDVTMWDNRATWHKAINDYPGFRRMMHRVTVEGCTLQAAA